MGLVLAFGIGPDDGYFDCGLCHHESFGGGWQRCLCTTGLVADFFGWRVSAVARRISVWHLGQFCFPHGGGRLYSGRCGIDCSKSGEEFFWHRHSPWFFRSQSFTRPGRTRRTHQSFYHRCSRSDGGELYCGQALVAQSTAHDCGHGQWQCVGFWVKRAMGLGVNGDHQHWRVADWLATLIDARLKRKYLAAVGTHCFRSSSFGADRGRVYRSGHGAQKRAADRWQPRVHRPRPVEFSRQFFLGLRVKRLL